MFITFDSETTDLIWKIGQAKSDWFEKNNWPIFINRSIKFGVSESQARTYNQFCGLCGEAALWQWLYGDLSEFWKQQAFLHESKALTDGGQDMPGLDIKTRDLITDPVPWLIITPEKLNTRIRYVLCVVQSHEPVKPDTVTVQIVGSIHGEVVDRLKDSWMNPNLNRITIDQEYLTPPEMLKWDVQPL